MSRRVAVHREIPIDLALPLEAFVPAFPRGRGAFLLDGAGGPEGAGLARFALFGGEPVMSVCARREGDPSADGTARLHVRVTREGGEASDFVVTDPFPLLRSLLAERARGAAELAPLPLPLRTGAVGYLGYELGQTLERLPCLPRPREALPDLALFFHDWVLGRDLGTGRTWLSVVGRGEDEAEATRAAEAIAERVTTKLAAVEGPRPTIPEAPAREPRTPPEIAGLAEALGARPALTEQAYLEAVSRAKRHIEAGDAFEICLTNALEVPWQGDAFELWRELRRANPSPFAAWLDTPEGAIVSASPERFLALDAQGNAESRPIKGTRPRGVDSVSDEALAAELAASEKDRAENAMIVDLVRSDLGRVCRYGSVHVPVLQGIERYPSVHQMVSTVRGVLAEGKDGLDLVRACFPPGSMTGAPKIEAMSILERLEPVERGVYSGALGFFDDGGGLDLSVVIRAAVVRGGYARVSVGGAVVADSSEVAEHDETLVKARALLEALARTRSASP